MAASGETRISSIRLIDEQLKINQVKRDVDVIELYLGKKKLKNVCSFERFKNLQRVWLNGNLLRHIDCFSMNLRITELYLQHNNILDITGSLSHLTTLNVLMLQNNQLEKLEKVVKELKQMQDLRVLNLFHNPVAQETDYKMYVIHHLPSVELLDRKEVSLEDRKIAHSIYNQREEVVKESIGFGRRSEGPPDIVYPSERYITQPTIPVSFDVGNNFYRNNPPYEIEEEAVNDRLSKKSTMDYSKFDWSKVPNSEQRRISEKPFETPQIVTVRFR
ncbi:leucine-rich repeat-containing protein 72-like [Tubulanus polymorphus]|uniref:leucine-rich repeat-containing protein 72-like n=1 Tax=Tubulanus polymorphus TaxID=672921 RepID=UPI003DA584DD